MSSPPPPPPRFRADGPDANIRGGGSQTLLDRCVPNEKKKKIFPAVQVQECRRRRQDRGSGVSLARKSSSGSRGQAHFFFLLGFPHRQSFVVVASAAAAAAAAAAVATEQMKARRVVAPPPDRIGQSIFTAGSASLPRDLEEHCLQWVEVSDVARLYLASWKAARLVARALAGVSTIALDGSEVPDGKRSSPTGGGGGGGGAPTSAIDAVSHRAASLGGPPPTDIGGVLPDACAFGFRLVCRYARRLQDLHVGDPAVCWPCRQFPLETDDGATGSRLDPVVLDATRHRMVDLVARNSRTLRNLTYLPVLASPALLLAVCECPHMRHLAEEPNSVVFRTPLPMPAPLVAIDRARCEAYLCMARELREVDYWRVSAHPWYASAVLPYTVVRVLSLAEWPLRALFIHDLPLACVAEFARFATTLETLDLTFVLRAGDFVGVDVGGVPVGDLLGDVHARAAALDDRQQYALRFRMFATLMADALPRLTALRRLRVEIQHEQATHLTSLRDESLDAPAVVWRSASLQTVTVADASTDRYHPWPRVEAPALVGYDGCDLTPVSFAALLQASPLLAEFDMSIRMRPHTRERRVAERARLQTLAAVIDALGVRPMRVVRVWSNGWDKCVAAAIARNWRGVRHLTYHTRDGEGDEVAQLLLETYRETLEVCRVIDGSVYDAQAEGKRQPLQPAPAPSSGTPLSDAPPSDTPPSDTPPMSASAATLVVPHLTDLVLRYASDNASQRSSPVGGGGNNAVARRAASPVGLLRSLAASLARFRWPSVECVVLDLALGPDIVVGVLRRLAYVRHVRIESLGAAYVDLARWSAAPVRGDNDADASADADGKNHGGSDGGQRASEAAPRTKQPHGQRKQPFMGRSSSVGGGGGVEVDGDSVDDACSATELELMGPMPHPHLSALLSWMPRLVDLVFPLELAGVDSSNAAERLMPLRRLAVIATSRLQRLTCLALVGGGYDAEPHPETTRVLRELATAFSKNALHLVAPDDAHEDIYARFP
jgi:hypothetical protein